MKSTSVEDKTDTLASLLLTSRRSLIITLAEALYLLSNVLPNKNEKIISIKLTSKQDIKRYMPTKYTIKKKYLTANTKGN